MGFFSDLWDKITAQPPTGKGSFRGVPFYIIDDSNQSGGHRIVKHMFPGRQTGKIENMGAQADEYSIYCVLIGDDYLEQKETLIAALREPEPADLEHPFHDTLYVQVETWNCRVSTHEQRIAMFQITFSLAEKEESPEADTDGEADLLDQNESLLEQIANDVAEVWETINAVAADIEAAITFATNVVNNITNMITGLSSLGGFSSILGRVQGLQGAIGNLIKSPKKLISNLTNLFKGFTSSGGKGSKSSAQRALRSIIVSVENMPLSERPAAAKMQEAIRSAVVIAALTELAQSAVSDANDIIKGRVDDEVAVTLDGEVVVIDTDREELLTDDRPLVETLDDCERLADELGDELADEYIRAADAFWFNTATRLQRLRLTFLDEMKKAAAELPNARKVTPHITEPALVILYRETGDSALISRFIQRNALRHPTFVRGGEAVEVIDDQ
ncbi:Mu-like prophage DNA circulation protein [Leminorella richardii]|uniref:Mu-like prophage DNA circulation protein n=1 Tax=Leminorella richardii TaxID=158841 RepID=A0A2X4U6U0_9GAMM|nr:DNA circularization N-terminal domain-containing protein [Leminorella richardii]SQI34923.1 Mu-like prophage DNA circulation protein [Leminorella richardii]